MPANFGIGVALGNLRNSIAAAVATAVGQQTFTTNTSWVVPAGVTNISAVAVGRGGDGGAYGGGGGGALAYAASIPVTPGETLTIVFDESGALTRIKRGALALLTAGNGGAGSGSVGGNGGTFSGSTGGVGGQGGTSVSSQPQGGGGAGGYTGGGGAGGTDQTDGNGTAGAGGGGGGGGYFGGDGGGVGLLGQGSSGGAGGGGSSGGPGSGGSGKTYGGGGRGNGGVGGGSGVRIIWGAGRAYPSTNTANAGPLSNNMTSNTTPAPSVAYSDGTAGAGFEAYRAFDGSTATRWLPPSTAVGWILRRDFGAANAFVLSNYAITSNTSGSFVQGWRVEGSNDAVSWTVVDERVGYGFSTLERKVLACSSPNATPFRYYQFISTAAVNYAEVVEFEVNP
jgi:hypothetical protein